jgi:hypothetical protein
MCPQFYDAPGGWGGAVFPVKEGVPPRIKRRVAAPDPFQQIGLVPFVDTVHNRLTVEIRRGCTRGCRWAAAVYLMAERRCGGWCAAWDVRLVQLRSSGQPGCVQTSADAVLAVPMITAGTAWCPTFLALCPALRRRPPRFCQPGMLTRPARDVEPSRVVDAVEHGMRLTVGFCCGGAAGGCLPAGVLTGQQRRLVSACQPHRPGSSVVPV